MVDNTKQANQNDPDYDLAFIEHCVKENFRKIPKEERRCVDEHLKEEVLWKNTSLRSQTVGDIRCFFWLVVKAAFPRTFDSIPVRISSKSDEMPKELVVFYWHSRRNPTTSRLDPIGSFCDLPERISFGLQVKPRQRNIDSVRILLLNRTPNDELHALLWQLFYHNSTTSRIKTISLAQFDQIDYLIWWWKMMRL